MTNTILKETYQQIIDSVPSEKRTPSVRLGQQPPPAMEETEWTTFGVSGQVWDVVESRLNRFNLNELIKQSKEKLFSLGLRIGNGLIPTMPIPLPINGDFLKEQAVNLRKLSQILDRAEEEIRMGKHTEIHDLFRVGLTPFDKRFLDAGIERSPQELNKLTKKRWDTFPTADGLRVIEQNRIACEGIQYSDGLWRYAEWFSESYLEEQDNLPKLRNEVYNWLLAHYRNHPASKDNDRPRIAVSVERGFPIKETELPMVVDRFNELAEIGGLSKGAVLAHPEDFIVQDDKMFVKNGDDLISVDMVWVNSYELSGYDETSIKDYWTILEHPDRFPVAIDGLSRIGASKLLQSALLHLPWFQEQLQMSTEEKSLVRTYVPFAVDPCLSQRVVVNGLEINTNDYLASYKDWLITKPSIGSHGEGFEAGINHSPESWASIVDRCTQGGFIFQERVPYPAFNIPTINPQGELTRQAMCMDFNVQLVGTNGYSVITRMSPVVRHADHLTTMNVSGGGGLGSVRLVDK